MAMTKTRKASVSTSRRATTRQQTRAEFFDISEDEIVELYTECRKEVSDSFGRLNGLNAGEKGDRTVAYTQKIHWSLLDQQAHNEVWFRLLTRAFKTMGQRVEQLEEELRAARDEIKKYATRDGFDWMQPIPRSRASKRGNGK